MKASDFIILSIMLTMCLAGSLVAQPEIDPDPWELVFGDVKVGETERLVLTIGNAGDEDLTVLRISSDNDVFNAELELPAQPFFEYINTFNSMAVLVLETTLNGENLAAGDEIGILTPDGVCAGAWIIAEEDIGEMIGLAAWPDDPDTDEIEGFQAGERLDFSIWDVSIFTEYEADVTVVAGDIEFSQNGFLQIELESDDENEHHLVGETIEPDGSIEVPITFTPAEMGDFEGTLNIISTDPQNQEIAVDLSGTGVTPHIVVEPDIIDFGSVLINQSRERNITISNEGIVDLIVDSFSIEGQYYTCDADPPLLIEPDSSRTVPITFTPEEFGEFEGTLSVYSDDLEHQVETVALIGDGNLNAVENDMSGNIPSKFRLSEAYPNPFNSAVIIPYSLPVKSQVTVRIFDLSGSLAATLFHNDQEPGFHSATWKADGFPAGVYLVIMSAAEFSATRKVVLVR